MSAVFLNGQPVLQLSLHLPLNGAWSGEAQVSSDVLLNAGDLVTLNLPTGVLYQGRVVRAGISDERLNVRMTGGAQDWGQQVDLKHYHKSDGDAVLRDLGITADTPLELDLEFWTRPPGTIGMAVQALATVAGVNWRVNPNGTMRIRDEAPFVVAPDAIEISRDERRGIVEVAPELAAIMPGTTFGADSIGDVIYDFGDTFRCRYYVQQRARLRGALERLVRWVTRDALFLGQYTAQVVTQGADGTLDLMPDDARLRASGLQSVPIRHGLPGVRVKVSPGSRVLLGFDNGDARSPYAALWHEGQVLEVQIGGAIPVAMSTQTDANFQALATAFNTHVHTWPGGLAPLPTTTPALATPPTPPVIPAPTASLLLKTL